MTALLVVAYLAVSYGAARWLWARSDTECYDKPLFLVLGLLWPFTVVLAFAVGRSLPSKKP